LQDSESHNYNSDESKIPIAAIGNGITDESEERSSSSSRWFGLIASISVGMMLAVLAFPIVEFALRSARSYVTTSYKTEINRRVDQYGQIHGTQTNVQGEELFPFNLASSGWQELHSEILRPAFREDAAKNLSGIDLWWIDWMPCPSEVPVGGTICDFPSALSQVLYETIHEQQLMPWGDDGDWHESIPLESSGLADYLLLSLPSYVGTARSAYGQDVVIKDGRVFFRALPNEESPKK
jgi:hypothetical protein